MSRLIQCGFQKEGNTKRHNIYVAPTHVCVRKQDMFTFNTFILSNYRQCQHVSISVLSGVCYSAS